MSTRLSKQFRPLYDRYQCGDLCCLRSVESDHRRDSGLRRKQRLLAGGCALDYPHRVCNDRFGTDSAGADVGFQATYHGIFSRYRNIWQLILRSYDVLRHNSPKNDWYFTVATLTHFGKWYRINSGGGSECQLEAP